MSRASMQQGGKEVNAKRSGTGVDVTANITVVHVKGDSTVVNLRWDITKVVLRCNAKTYVWEGTSIFALACGISWAAQGGIEHFIAWDVGWYVCQLEHLSNIMHQGGYWNIH